MLCCVVQNVWGRADPGDMVALMGPSGEAHRLATAAGVCGCAKHVSFTKCKHYVLEGGESRRSTRRRRRRGRGRDLWGCASAAVPDVVLQNGGALQICGGPTTCTAGSGLRMTVQCVAAAAEGQQCSVHLANPAAAGSRWLQR